jgi:hypothetical protein
MSRGGSVYYASGTPTEYKTVEPTDKLKTEIAGYLNSADITGMRRIPVLKSDAVPLFNICVYNGTIIETVKRTDYSHNSTISYTGLVASITASSVNVPNSNYIYLGDINQPFYKQKDAFTYTESITVPSGVYKVRVRRINSGASDISSSEYTTLHDAILYTGTSFANNTPVTDDSSNGGYYARTAIRIRATDQVNGSVDGINALVTSICYDWNGTTWTKAATNNPASLFRYVLQHPANAQAISDTNVANKIDLPQLQYWHA